MNIGIIKNVEKNTYTNMLEGNFWVEKLGQYIQISYDPSIDFKYVEESICYFDRNISQIQSLLAPSILRFCKNQMKNYPDVDYPIGMECIDISSVWNFVKIEELHIDCYEPNLKDLKVLNLYGSCDWEFDDGLQWLIRDGKVIYSGAWNNYNVWQSADQLDCGNYA